MKRLYSRIRPFLAMFLGDFMLIVMMVLLLLTALQVFKMSYVKISLTCVVVGFTIAVLFTKYKFLYKRLGRDDVTGGKNKKEFERIASSLIRGNGTYVMVCANIDRFKLINDSYGEATGDEVLRSIQTIIDEELRWDEVSGRIMGDNFGLLMRYHSIPMLDHRLARISEEIASLRDAKDKLYGLVMYYGVYVLEEEDRDITMAVEFANLASERLLPSYHVPMGIYNEKDRKKLNREKELEMKMRKSLEKGEFVPYLQPKYELEKETVAGAEALVRWISESEGMIFPDEFIPLFEKNGFVVDIDLYMFEEVCRFQEKWYKQGKTIVPISVNLSRSHFEVENFFDYYKEILDRYELPEKCIEIELTESLFYNKMETLNDLVTQIHEAGLSCSIDDFGSGYSSLNMLKDVKVDALKLDRVFFQTTEDDGRGKSIIRSVLQLAQSLNLHTISEGVEEREQVDFLKDMNCDLIQGYVFAKPMSIFDFEKLVYLSAD